MKYLFAIKNVRVLCIRYTDNAAYDFVYYAIDKGYDLEIATYMNWARKEDRFGGRIQTYEVNSNTPLNFL